MSKDLKSSALDYHKYPRPGKYSISATKPMANQRDLSLAYSPGVAIPCEEIAANPDLARDYTTRGNVVAVISNGTAVLGLGNIGALASKPVMEGKAVLFKKFADIDAVDIEVDETDIDAFVETVARLEPTFGGINLEDIKAPECFEIERRLREKMNIPVFHDDQHGTAIIVGAAAVNWARLTNRELSEIKVVTSGAGAAAMACLGVLSELGVKRDNIMVLDRQGVIYTGRDDSAKDHRDIYAQDTKSRTLEDAIEEFKPDMFLGVSGPGVLKQESLKHFAKDPIIMGLANPTPEIMPELVYEARPDAYMCTGRSDYPNQVNNVLCFPYLFRGALDCGATVINEEMKLAAVTALADLAMKEPHETVANAYKGEDLKFGKNYLIPKPFDPRLIIDLPVRVVEVAEECGVATRPIKDIDAYRQSLHSFVNRTNMVMRPVYESAKTAEKNRVIYAEGEEVKVMQAAQIAIDEGLAMPTLIGRRSVIEHRLKKHSLHIKPDVDFKIVDPTDDPRYHDYWMSYHELMSRKGVTPDGARTIMRTNASVIGSMLLEKGEGDALICGVVGSYKFHLRHVENIISKRAGIDYLSAMTLVVGENQNLFITDTHAHSNPDEAQIAKSAILACEAIEQFGMEPKAGLVSHSNFGSHDDPSALKMSKAKQILDRLAPDLKIEGEMQVDAALKPEIRKQQFPNCEFDDPCNLLVMPDLASANISFNLLKSMTNAVSIGPILLGLSKPVHIVTPSIGTRGLVNMTALAVAQANTENKEQELVL